MDLVNLCEKVRWRCEEFVGKKKEKKGLIDLLNILFLLLYPRKI